MENILTMAIVSPASESFKIYKKYSKDGKYILYAQNLFTGKVRISIDKEFYNICKIGETLTAES